MGGMIVTAGGDHCRRAIVLNTIRILVDALVQLRGSTQRERPEKSRENERRNKCAAASSCRTRERAHCAASFSPARTFRKRFLQDHLTNAKSL